MKSPKRKQLRIEWREYYKLQRLAKELKLSSSKTLEFLIHLYIADIRDIEEKAVDNKLSPN